MNINDAFARGVVDFGLFHQVLHGDQSTVVTTDGGSVPSVARAIGTVGDLLAAAGSATSTTAMTFGTGTKTWTIQAGKSFKPGQLVTVTSTSGFMFGTVSSYADTSLTVSVKTFEGSGVAASWNVTYAGPQGASGRNAVDGQSAYQTAVNNGYPGTEVEWLASLKGDRGLTGFSAFEIAQAHGYSGTETQWLDSLKGADGTDGTDGTNGKSAYQIALDNGFVGTASEWLAYLKGKDGVGVAIKGQKADQASLPAGAPLGDAYVIGSDIWVNGDQGWFNAGVFLGTAGADGKSAYQLALDNGFFGTEADWLLSLHGSQGDKGDPGTAGTAGKSAYQLAVEGGFTGTQTEWLNSLKGAPGVSAPLRRLMIKMPWE